MANDFNVSNQLIFSVHYSGKNFIANGLHLVLIFTNCFLPLCRQPITILGLITTDLMIILPKTLAGGKVWGNVADFFPFFIPLDITTECFCGTTFPITYLNNLYRSFCSSHYVFASK